MTRDNSSRNHEQFRFWWFRRHKNLPKASTDVEYLYTYIYIIGCVWPKDLVVLIDIFGQPKWLQLSFSTSTGIFMLNPSSPNKTKKHQVWCYTAAFPTGYTAAFSRLWKISSPPLGTWRKIVQCPLLVRDRVVMLYIIFKLYIIVYYCIVILYTYTLYQYISICIHIYIYIIIFIVWIIMDPCTFWGMILVATVSPFSGSAVSSSRLPTNHRHIAHR